MMLFTVYIIGIIIVTSFIMSQTKDARLVLSIALVGLLLNLVWEIGQMYWYQGFSSFGDHIVCVPAAFGDALAVLCIYAVVSSTIDDWYWLKQINKRTVLITVLIGGFLAIVMEQRALSLGLWAYTSDMPLVPYFHVGLLPVVQMMILPIITYVLVHRFFLVRNGKKL